MKNPYYSTLNKVVMSRVVHFEIPAENPEKTMTFYKDVFGWKFEKWGNEEYWLVSTTENNAPGLNGGLIKKTGSNKTIANTITVNDLDSITKKIIENGGQMIGPKMPISSFGWLVYFKDVDNNIFGVMEKHKNIN